jgi:hypothetical protein
MNKRTVLVILLLPLFYHTNIAFGQVNIALGGKKYVIPQVSNDILSGATYYNENDSLLKAGHFIQPISSSKYDLEIRFFYAYNDILNNFKMIIIKGNRHWFSMERYDCSRVYLITNNAQGVKLPGGTGYLWVKPKIYKDVNEQIGPILSQLIDMGLFNYPDKANFIKDGDSLKYLASSKSLSDYIFEIKVNERYHSFRYDPRIYKNNPDVKELVNGNTITNVFLKLLQNQ